MRIRLGVDTSHFDRHVALLVLIKIGFKASVDISGWLLIANKDHCKVYSS